MTASDDGEDGAGGGDAEGQRPDGNGRERRGSPQPPARSLQVASQFHHQASRDVTPQRQCERRAMTGTVPHRSRRAGDCPRLPARSLGANGDSPLHGVGERNGTVPLSPPAVEGTVVP